MVYLPTGEQHIDVWLNENLGHLLYFYTVPFDHLTIGWTILFAITRTQKTGLPQEHSVDGRNPFCTPQKGPWNKDPSANINQQWTT